MAQVKTEENVDSRLQTQSGWHGTISGASDAEFEAEPDRYVLYFNYSCPFAHRALITRGLKGIGNDLVRVVEVDGKDKDKGWEFVETTDPVYGVRYLRELYERVQPGYSGRVTVPLLWDTKKETIVNNESSEIMRMFDNCFDALLPNTETNHSLYPPQLRSQIDDLNEWVQDTINTGVYKCFFPPAQDKYEEALQSLFQALDNVEERLHTSNNQPYLFGEHITETDVRLFATLIRFDVAYYPLFLCNLKMIRLDYPQLHKWMRNLYWDDTATTNHGAFRQTLNFDKIISGYARLTDAKHVPKGPLPRIMSQ